MRSLTFGLCLFASSAFAEVSTRALIWGGGATPDAAATALKDFRENKAASDLFEFTAGYPKVVESASVAGLKPGFHVVLLGVCGADESQLALAVFKALQPQVYARPVQITERNCPKLKGEWKPETKTNGSLSAIGLKGPSGEWMVLVSLLDAAGEIIDFKAVQSSDEQCVRGAELGGWDADEKSVSVDYTCMSAGCTTPDEQDISVTITLSKKRLALKSKLGKFRKGECD